MPRDRAPLGGLSQRDPAARQRWLVATTEYAGVTAYTGGIGRHYAALLPALVRQGVDVDLAIFADGPCRSTADADGVRIIALESTAGVPPLRALVRNARAVARLYRGRRYDRVFLPEWTGLGSALPRSSPLLTNLATGVRLANEVSRLRLRDLPPSRRPALIVQAALEARQIRRSAGLVAISTAMLAWTRSAFAPVPPAAVVRNCIDVDAVQRAGRAATAPAGWPRGDGPVVLFLGRVERRKGVIEAFEGFARLHAGFPAARLVIAGASGDARFEPTRQQLLDRLPASARPRVTWLGYVPGDDLYGAIREASVVVCPSRWEGFGNVALEVKAVGTPLIATSGSGYDDFCADGVDCLLARPGDGDDLGACLLRVLRDPAQAAERAARAQGGVDAFAPDPVARDLLAAADALLGSVPRT